MYDNCICSAHVIHSISFGPPCVCVGGGRGGGEDSNLFIELTNLHILALPELLTGDVTLCIYTNDVLTMCIFKDISCCSSNTHEDVRCGTNIRIFEC